MADNIPVVNDDRLFGNPKNVPCENKIPVNHIFIADELGDAAAPQLGYAKNELKNDLRRSISKDSLEDEPRDKPINLLNNLQSQKVTILTNEDSCAIQESSSGPQTNGTNTASTKKIKKPIKMEIPISQRNLVSESAGRMRKRKIQKKKSSSCDSSLHEKKDFLSAQNECKNAPKNDEIPVSLRKAMSGSAGSGKEKITKEKSSSSESSMHENAGKRTDFRSGLSVKNDEIPISHRAFTQEAGCTQKLPKEKSTSSESFEKPKNKNYFLVGQNVCQTTCKNASKTDEEASLLDQVSDASLLSRLENHTRLQESICQASYSRKALVFSRKSSSEVIYADTKNVADRNNNSSFSRQKLCEVWRDPNMDKPLLSRKSHKPSYRGEKMDLKNCQSSRESSMERTSKNSLRQKSTSLKRDPCKRCHSSRSSSPQREFQSPSKLEKICSIPRSFYDSSLTSFSEEPGRSRVFHSDDSTGFESSLPDSDFSRWSKRLASKTTPKRYSTSRCALPTDNRRVKMSPRAPQRTPRRREPPRPSRLGSGRLSKEKVHLGQSDDEDSDGGGGGGWSGGNDEDETEADSDDDDGHEFKSGVVNIINSFRYLLGLTLAEPIVDTFNYANLLNLSWESGQKAVQHVGIGAGARRFIANFPNATKIFKYAINSRPLRSKLGPILEESSLDDEGSDGGNSSETDDDDDDEGGKIGCFGKMKNKFKKKRQDDDSDDPYIKQQNDERKINDDGNCSADGDDDGRGKAMLGCFGKLKDKFRKKQHDDDSDNPYMRERSEGSDDEELREGYR